MMSMTDLAEHFKQPSGALKPVIMMTVDGGPDENPR